MDAGFGRRCRCRCASACLPQEVRGWIWHELQFEMEISGEGGGLNVELVECTFLA